MVAKSQLIRKLHGTRVETLKPLLCEQVGPVSRLQISNIYKIIDQADFQVPATN